MSKDFSHLRVWLTGEGYPKDCPSRPVILECIPSRSGLSMGVYDRGERIFIVPSAVCGGGLGLALSRFLCAQFQPELMAWIGTASKCVNAGHQWEGRFVFEYGLDFENVVAVAEAIHLKVTRSESKAGTLIVISKKG